MLTTKQGNDIRECLLARCETISVAESVTSGYLQLALSGITGAEQFYQGGITTYNIGQKSRHLHIEPIHARATNCVSPSIAQQMAMQVCHLFSSAWGVGITGYATPVPESGNRLFCHFAIAHRGNIVMADTITSRRMPPRKVQELFASRVLIDLHAAITGV